MRPSTLLCATTLSLLAFVGCSSPKVVSRFPASKAATWEAARSVLVQETGENPTEEEGYLRTEWQPETSGKRQGWVTGGQYLRRIRYDVWVIEDGEWSQVEVLAHLQFRPPAGRRNYRWERLPAQEYARELLAKLGKILRAQEAPPVQEPAPIQPAQTQPGEVK